MSDAHGRDMRRLLKRAEHAERCLEVAAGRIERLRAVALTASKIYDCSCLATVCPACTTRDLLDALEPGDLEATE